MTLPTRKIKDDEIKQFLQQGTVPNTWLQLANEGKFSFSDITKLGSELQNATVRSQATLNFLQTMRALSQFTNMGDRVKIGVNAQIDAYSSQYQSNAEEKQTEKQSSPKNSPSTST